MDYATDMGVYRAGNPGTNHGIRVAHNYIHNIGKVASEAGFGVSLKRVQKLIEDNEIMMADDGIYQSTYILVTQKN